MTALHNRTVLAWDGPPAVAARGTLIVVPGRGENPGLYERFGTRLAFDAYRVRAVEDPTADPDGVREQVLALLADPTLPSPRVLVGSDAGALFAVSLLVTGTAVVDALVLAGLPVSGEVASHGTEWDSETEWNAETEWDAELASRTACPTHQARLSADQGLRRGALAAPPPADWFDTAVLDRVEVPVLGLHGADDAVSPIAEAAAQYASSPNATLVRIAGGRHDALNDATHRTAAATIVLFLERLRLGADLPVIAETGR
jgi:alpha-beta hydrolase superfamily lysophospholipase